MSRAPKSSLEAARDVAASPPPSALRKQLWSWLGPVFVCAGVLSLHATVTVPSGPMIGKPKPGKRAKKKKKGKDRQREAKAFAEEKADLGFVARHAPAMDYAFELAVSDVRARKGRSPGEALEVVGSSECRRWRCQIEICGPRKQVRAVHRVFRRLRLEDDKLWDAFEVKKPPKPKEGKGKATADAPHCVRSTVRFSRPAPELKGIRVAKAKAKKPKAKAAKRDELKPERLQDATQPTGAQGKAAPSPKARP